MHPAAVAYLRNRPAVLSAERAAEEWCAGTLRTVRQRLQEDAARGELTNWTLDKAPIDRPHFLRLYTQDYKARLQQFCPAGTSSVQLFLDLEDTFQASGDVPGTQVRISLTFNSVEAFKAVLNASARLPDSGARFAAARDRMRRESTPPWDVSTASWVRRIGLDLLLDGRDSERIRSAVLVQADGAWRELLGAVVDRSGS